MSDMQFSNNYRDLSNSTGVDAGFQFEFYCERCSDRWRTHFRPYRSAQASGWLQKGANMFGGLLGNAGSVLGSMAEAGWHSARDEAFTEAVAAGKAHFNRCGNCHDYVCGQCFDGASGLCFDRAPQRASQDHAGAGAGRSLRRVGKGESRRPGPGRTS
ncbi:hypothetical protein [Massilia sp. Mn16-1_5]|uniref:hypothetical protein n=1 Tax=Massilia sp. Mn16-1_5 TaxID=2079199 RepID=UPI001E3E32CE|nr:hypothetical protein [Massilia sp. Mn16-1_5]